MCQKRGQCDARKIESHGYACADFTHHFPANINLFKVNNRNTRKRCEICLKLTIKTPERCDYSLLELQNGIKNPVRHLW